jgi:hypothetical protein
LGYPVGYLDNLVICSGYALPTGDNLCLNRARMASKGLRVVVEGSSIGAWERTVQADQGRPTSI